MKIGIVGCAGRMGRMLIAEVMANANTQLVGGTEYEGSAFIGHDLGILAGRDAAQVMVSADADALFAMSDAVIDFTIPLATCLHATLAAKHGTVLVVGTTGLSADDQATINDASAKAAIVQAANFSVGVNLLRGLARLAAQSLGDDFDIEIVEMHHRHKIDAPSGTALALGQSVASGRDVDLDTVAVRSRDGITGERKRGDIGFATLRGGDVVGDHTVMYAGDGERVELTHKASNRSIFARGAVRAALWAGGREPGLYSMDDVLGF